MGQITFAVTAVIKIVMNFIKRYQLLSHPRSNNATDLQNLNLLFSILTF
jgi:hypothetical protein